MARPNPAPAPDDGSDPLANAHSRQVELAILSVVLDGRHQDAWQTVIEGCDGAVAFYARDHRLLAMVIDQMAAAGARVDSQTVAAAAGQIRFSEAADALRALEGQPRPSLRQLADLDHADSVLAEIGSHSGLSDIASAHGSVTGLAQNVAALAGYHRQRRMISLMVGGLAKARAVDGAKKGPAIAEEIINGLSNIAGTGQGIDSIGRGAEQALAEIREIVAHGDQTCASWGVKPLDEACRLKPGALIVLAARPGCGKTSMLLQSACATHRQFGPEHVALISLEMTTAELARILIAREISVGTKMIDSGWLSAEQVLAFEQRAKAWRENDIIVKGTGGRGSIGEMTAWIRATHRRSRGKLKLMGIDYLQLLHGSNPKQNSNERIGEITRELKIIARDLGICVLLLSQMNRESAKDKRKPMLTDLRDSGSIEQDANAVVFLWSNAERDDSTTVSAYVAKNRAGPKADIGLEFLRGRGQVFQEIGGDRPSRGERAYGEPTDAEDVLNEPPQEQQP